MIADSQASAANGASNLPTVATASLPVAYERAKEALAACDRVDECKEWADKAAALASYAKQSEDDTLYKHAVRIRARAIRRCGELLKEIGRPKQGGRPPKNGGGTPTVSQAAEEAGLSRDQRVTAIRVASVPAEDFDEAVESDEPPTITALADAGKATKPKPLIDLKGRDPADFAASTDAQGNLRRLFEAAERIPAARVARGAFPHERRDIEQQAMVVQTWLRDLLREVAEAEE